MQVLLLESEELRSGDFESAFHQGKVDADIVAVSSFEAVRDALATGDVTLLVVNAEEPGADTLNFLKKLRAEGDWTPACIYTSVGSEHILDAMEGWNCLTRLDKTLGMDKVATQIKDMLYLTSDEGTEKLDSIEAIADEIQTVIKNGESKLNGLE